MKKSRITDNQFIAILKEAEAGIPCLNCEPGAWHQAHHRCATLFVCAVRSSLLLCPPGLDEVAQRPSERH